MRIRFVLIFKLLNYYLLDLLTSRWHFLYLSNKSLEFLRMASSASYSYSERSIFDIKTLIEALRFIIVNAILAFIFLFLTIEEIDWAVLSSRDKINDIVIDNTSWNIKKIF